jgi:hypothetical protein
MRQWGIALVIVLILASLAVLGLRWFLFAIMAIGILGAFSDVLLGRGRR